MDLERVIAELVDELKQIDQAIHSLEQLSVSGHKKRGRPPKWLVHLRARDAPGFDGHPSKRKKKAPDGKPHSET